MDKVIALNPYDAESIARAIKEVRAYKAWVKAKEAELCKKLADIGCEVAKVGFSQAIYDGEKQVSVVVLPGTNFAIIEASGKSVGFIEFGSGAKFGSGHPMAEQVGAGPGTYSTGPDGKGHWDDPNGWFYAHGKRSWGNPPAMAMLGARDEVAAKLTIIAREVFA